MAMSNDATDLILEQFRILRAEIEGIRTELRQGLTSLGQRLDHLETEVRGVNYVATVSIGSVLADLNDLKARVKRLEDA